MRVMSCFSGTKMYTVEILKLGEYGKYYRLSYTTRGSIRAVYDARLEGPTILVGCRISVNGNGNSMSEVHA